MFAFLQDLKTPTFYFKGGCFFKDILNYSALFSSSSTIASLIVSDAETTTLI